VGILNPPIDKRHLCSRRKAAGRDQLLQYLFFRPSPPSLRSEKTTERTTDVLNLRRMMRIDIPDAFRLLLSA